MDHELERFEGQPSQPVRGKGKAGYVREVKGRFNQCFAANPGLQLTW
jgi:hypothetical protein